MSLQIIYGKSGSGKTRYIFDQISGDINNGKKKYILTPEQFSFTAEKELLKKLRSNNNMNSVIDAEVLTFNRMAHRVAAEVGGSKNVALSDSGKSMILYNILSNNKNELKFLGKSDSNIDLILTQLTELKKHGVRLENVEQLLDDTKENKYLHSKLEDIYLVYNQYEEQIQNKYIDENDSLTVLAEQLDSTNMFKDCEIYIDEFVGFTKQEYQIIAKLMKSASKVIVTITADDLQISKSPDADIFYSNKQTANNILKIAKDNEVKIEKSIGLSEIKRFKSPELLHLEENIFNLPYNIYKKEVNSINLFLANNQYSEIENVAQNIIKLVRDNGYRYKEISIITQNIDTYSNLCKAIFNKYNIPIYMDERKELSQNVLIKYILSILEIFAKNWSLESVFNYIKTGFTQLNEEEAYELEKYAIKWNVCGNKWYKEDWKFHDEKELGKEKVERINRLREAVVSPLVDLKNNLSATKTAKQISEQLYYFLIKNEVDKKLQGKIDYLNEIGELNKAQEYEISWNTAMQVLDEMVMIFGEEKISFDNYMKILKIGFVNSSLGTIPMAQDQVVIGDVDRSKTHKVRAVFIIGLNDGNFPTVNKSEGFLNDEDRENIKTYGVELAKGTLERIYEDNFNIYKAFSTAEEKLFLSYASSDSSGKSLRSSVLMSKIKKIFPLLKQESDIIEKNTSITSKEATFEELLNQLRCYRDGEQIDEIWFKLYNVFMADDEWNSRLSNAIKALNYTNAPEKITNENLDKMYGNTLQTSISKLEQYRRCPFSYYLKYGLKLNDKEISKVEAVDTGSFMHDVIDSFFNVLEENKIAIKEIEDKQIEEILEQIVSEKLKLDRNFIFTTTAKYLRLVSRLKKVVITSVKYIVQTIKQSEFTVLGHEIEFGQKSKYEPIKIHTDSGKTVEIVGKIDRVDVAKNADGTYVRIIDYKSSIKNVDLNQVVAGLQLQLLTYLNETCRVEDFLPAGVLYFNLSEQRISADSNMTDEEIENLIKQKFKMQGLILADVNVIKMMDTKIEEKGVSDIIPAGVKKDGEISSKYTKGITAEQFKYLQKYMDKIIKQISEEILSGEINIKPSYNLKVQKGKTPCEYCKYKSICKFDANNKGNDYNYIGTLNKEAILEMIKEQTDV